jgi:hypothetical protein
MVKKCVCTSLLLMVLGINIYGEKGPKIISPSKNITIINLDPDFLWKAIEKPGLTYELKIAEDQLFTINVIQLQTTTPFLKLTLPYLEKGKSYYWTIRAVYTDKQQPVKTTWAHEDKKDRNYFRFTVSPGAIGFVGYQPTILTPGSNGILNSLQPEFRWLYPNHKDAGFLIKNNNNEWVSPELVNITYRLMLSSDREFEKDSKTFDIKNDSLKFKLTIPFLRKGISYWWRIKAIYNDPEKNIIKESAWSASAPGVSSAAQFKVAEKATGKFGFNEGLKEELFDRNSIESVERLTQGTDNCFAPAVSKDGQKLAFCSDRMGQIEIFEINLNERIGSFGTGKTTHNEGKYNFNPFWLNNNTEVAFYSNRINESYWHLFNSNQGEAVTLLAIDLDMEENREDFNLFGSCSSDGKIVYTVKLKNSKSYDLYLLDLNENTKTQLLPGMSPDIRNDDRIVYSENVQDNYEIFIGELEGRAILRRSILTTNPASDYDPVLSPDGSRIAFTSTRSGNSDVWVMNSDGTNLKQLTRHPLVDRRPQWINNETLLFQSNRVINEKNEPVYNIFRITAPKI